MLITYDGPFNAVITEVVELTKLFHQYGVKDRALQILRQNPLVGYVLVQYSYTRDFGSDYCWSENVDAECNLIDWIHGIHHPGNCTYNYVLSGIKDGTEEGCRARLAKHLEVEEAARVKRAQEVRERQARIEAEAIRNSNALAKRDAEMEKFASGTQVTVKGAPGVVERIMVSRFNELKACALIRFPNGVKKWLDTGKLMVARTTPTEPKVELQRKVVRPGFVHIKDMTPEQRAEHAYHMSLIPVSAIAREAAVEVAISGIEDKDEQRAIEMQVRSDFESEHERILRQEGEMES